MPARDNTTHSSARAVTSNQPGPHPRLEETVRKHLGSTFQRPLPDYSRRAFDAHFAAIDNFRGPLVFDSFCGVGESTRQLAATLPEALVVGIDKSAHRLGRHGHYRADGDPGNSPNNNPDNYLLVRADTDDFWRQALAAGWRLQQHWLLYPNPWPKAAQLQRRCHGSPLFPTLLALGGALELRSNWRLYLDECHCALAIAGRSPEAVRELPPGPPLTPFERKYRAAGQALWQLRCELD